MGLYTLCLTGSLILLFLFLVLGDALDFIFDSIDFINGLTLISTLSVFGASGYLLTKYSVLGTIAVLIIAILIALSIATVVSIIYLKTKNNSDSSIAYSMKDLEGKVAEVITSIPEDGYGEVIIKMGASTVNYTAKSYDLNYIKEGSKVVVIMVDEYCVHVSKLNL
jgi:NfeD-like.